MGYRNHHQQFQREAFERLAKLSEKSGHGLGDGHVEAPGERPFPQRQRRGGPSPFEMFGPEFGFGGLGRGGRGGRGRRGPRVRRGDVRAAILDVLSTSENEDLNGYAVIGAIADKTEGAWKPSPGSVYPTISQLEDEGLVETVREGNRKSLKLTEDGRTYVAEHPDELAAVWSSFEEPEEELADLRHSIKQLMGAFAQVMHVGSAEQQAEAATILADARKKLYALLAED